MKKADGLINCIPPSCRYQLLASNRLLLFPLFWNSAGSKSVGKKTKLEKRRVTSTDLEINHEIYLSVKKTYPENSDRRNYFLAAGSLFFFSSENDLNYNVAIKLKAYGGLIGIDDYFLDKCLKDSKILRLHAILHDAAGFVDEVYNTGPTFCYILPWKCNSSLIGNLSGITFCLFVKVIRPVVDVRG